MYFRLEFPYPKDDPPKDKTAVVYKSNNPEFKHSFKVIIDFNSIVLRLK